MKPLLDQVFVSGYPRSGTTWTQLLVWLIKNDLDYAACESTNMQLLFPFFEVYALFHPNTLKRYEYNVLHDEKGLDLHKKSTPPFEDLIKSPFLSTHIPLSLLPQNLLDISKMVYVARDPRDVMVSFYYLTKGGCWAYGKDFKDMFKNIISGNMLFCPYFEHIKEAWAKRHNPNLLFLFYEDILNDRVTTLRRVCKFFNKSYSEEQLSGLANYLEFNNLKDKESFNHEFRKKYGWAKPDAQLFIRKGKFGGWRQHFDEEMSQEAEQWIADNLRGTDLRFPSLKTQ